MRHLKKINEEFDMADGNMYDVSVDAEQEDLPEIVADPTQQYTQEEIDAVTDEELIEWAKEYDTSGKLIPTIHKLIRNQRTRHMLVTNYLNKRGAGAGSIDTNTTTDEMYM